MIGVPIEVHKFGGTSLADAAGFRRAAAILVAQEGANAVVVSAPAGVTDTLFELAWLAANRDATHAVRLREVRRRVIETIGDLVTGDPAADLVRSVEADLQDVEDVLRAIWLMRTSPQGALDLIGGCGELWSARILTALLAQQGRTSRFIDAREVLVVEPGPLAPVVDDDLTRPRLTRLVEGFESGTLVFPGFVASTREGLPTTLGRNGSDYSASLFARLLGAELITIWTDVDGVLSADPRRVPDAQCLEELSYDEAMELAYFGAKVLHPATMGPAVERGIPIAIRNSREPQRPGTLIHHARRTIATGDESPASTIRGIASIDDMALLNLEGTHMIGVPGIAERLFGSLREAGVSVNLISQGSSEHSICFAVPAAQSELARRTVERAFTAERQAGQIQRIEVRPDCAAVAVVGDSMAGRPGVAGRFLSALGKAGVNVMAIAQGASERNISVVVDREQVTRAVRAIHSGFYLSDQSLSIGLIGPGLVGRTLLSQIAQRADDLLAHSHIDLRVRAIATSRHMLLEPRRIALEDWHDRLDREHVPTDLDALADHVQTESVPHAVIVDCTASSEVAERYPQWLERGIHVVTPNKIANTMSMERYHALHRPRHARYLYETTVGAALPIVQTLRDLIDTGDEVYRVEGILSGTLSYLFNAYDGERPFSALVREARERGLTEPDPRQDLSGMDVARKLVILARELGTPVEIDDVAVEAVAEDETDRSTEAFLADLDDLDRRMAARLDEARKEGGVLRYVGTIDPSAGCAVKLDVVAADHPFASVQGTDNIVLFRTRRYDDNPLVVQGPGAGPDVTAAGVFADLLRLATSLGR